MLRKTQLKAAAGLAGSINPREYKMHEVGGRVWARDYCTEAAREEFNFCGDCRLFNSSMHIVHGITLHDFLRSSCTSTFLFPKL